jgi:hypothetical protein
MFIHVFVANPFFPPEFPHPYPRSYNFDWLRTRVKGRSTPSKGFEISRFSGVMWGSGLLMLLIRTPRSQSVFTDPLCTTPWARVLTLAYWLALCNI